MAVSMAPLSCDDSANQVVLLFDQAKADFERETHQPLDLETLSRFESVEQLIDQIKSQRSVFGRFREHEHPHFIKHLRLALKPVQMLAKIIAGPAGNVSLFLSFLMLPLPS
jgi:hypothetical protein